MPLSRSGFSTAVESVGFDPNGHGLYLDHVAKRYVENRFFQKTTLESKMEKIWGCF